MKNVLVGLTVPAPAQVISARKLAGQTQAEAAESIGSSRGQTWQDYEAGRRDMPLVTWAIYLLSVGQHPTHRITEA